jgi:glycosyltransferase involved in cell wall biosynthesis
VRVLSEAFAARGMNVVVAGPAGAVNRSAIEAAGIRYETLPIVGDMTRARNDIPTTARILRLLRQGKFDLVHCHGMKAAFLARLVAPLTRTPVVYTPNSLTYRHQLGRSRPGARSRYLKTLLMERVLGRLTRAIVAVSEEERLAVVGDGLVSGDRVRVIFNGASVDLGVAADEELLAFRGEGPLLGMVAGLRDQKGLPTLLEALELLAARGEAVRFVIVGNGPLDGWVRERVGSGPLAGCTLVVGFGGRVEPYLRALDVFVLASYWEGLPIAVIEAMAAGLPVVASAVGGTPEAVVDGQTGFLVPVEDAGVLADRLSEVAGDRGLRERMGRAGRERALELFSVDRMVNATAELYEEIADAR